MPVQIADTFMECSLNDFQRACEVSIEEEQQKFAPNNARIALLTNAILLTWTLAAKERRCSELAERLIAAKHENLRLRAELAALRATTP